MQWDWKILSIVIPVCFFEVVIHEAAHLLVGRIHEKRKPTGFFPYPHFYKNTFYLARYTSALGKFDLIYYYRFNHLPRHIAPVFAGLLIFIISQLLMVVSPTAWNLWFVPNSVFGLMESLIFAWGYFFGSKRTDGKRWRYGEKGEPNNLLLKMY